jgi:Threonine dehydratase
MKQLNIIENNMKGSPADKLVCDFDKAYEFHKSLAEYRPTQLIELDSLASGLGVGSILVKDESERFGLNAFKGLGASYAAYRAAGKYRKGISGFISCTDGNHGRALACTIIENASTSSLFSIISSFTSLDLSYLINS